MLRCHAEEKYKRKHVIQQEGVEALNLGHRKSTNSFFHHFTCRGSFSWVRALSVRGCDHQSSYHHFKTQTTEAQMYASGTAVLTHLHNHG